MNDWKAGLSGGRALALGLAAAVAVSAQAPRRINLQTRNVDLASSCVLAGYRPEFKITNWGAEPFVLTQAVVRMFFQNDPQQPIEFVNADYVRIFNPNGSLTGNYATAFHFQGPPPTIQCGATPGRRGNQRHFIAFAPLPGGGLVTVPPNGGFATVVVSLRRAGGLAPFDFLCDDASKIVNENPSRPFVDDTFFSLVESGGMGAPSVTICEFLGPNTQDGGTGVDICAQPNRTGCDPQ